jgi:hypothetical protein
MATHRPNSARRRGSIYLYVLSSSLLIAIIGLGSMAVVRIQMRSSCLRRDYAEARAYATSAIELGLFYVKQDPAWRDTRPNGVWVQDQAIGSGRFTIQGVDPGDGVLSDSQYEPLVLTGIGTRGVTRHKAEVTLVPVIKPLEALQTCLHASGLVHILASKQIVAAGAPISTNGQLDNEGTLDGDAHAQTVNRTGTITGTFTLPAPIKKMPDASVIADYVGKATPLPYQATIDKAVLAPGCNPWGVGDPNGLYYVNTNGANMTIRNSRVNGTLIVRTGGGTLTVDTAVFFQNYRSDFPTLIVEGNVIINIKSCDMMLSEVTNSANYNPLGAPYGGVYDSDMLDTYPNEIRGLIHIKGSLNLQQSACIVGTVICDGPVTCEAANSIIYNPTLYTSPPTGYTYVAEMKISPGSWRQVVD